MNRSTLLHRHRWLLAAVVASVTAAAGAPATAADPARPASRQPTGPRPAATRTVVDAAVRPAGGMVCHECGAGGCRHGKLCHHRDCKNGVCAPYCPVRPGTFGYYGTQWRRWPGQGVVPASNVEAATPVKPPKSEVPGVDEESFGPKPDDLPEPATPDGGGDETTSRPVPPEPTAPTPPMPESTAPAAEPRVMPAETPEPPSKPAIEESPPTKPKAADLFDESAARKVRRKIPVHSAGDSQESAADAASVKPASHDAAATRKVPKAVPRVAFDPRAESARMREPR